MPLFDVYIFADWSAANGRGPERPKKDAVWVGEFVPGQGIKQETYHRTRFSGYAHVARALESHVLGRRRVLIGFDFPYGYPAGLAALLPKRDGVPPWLTVWSELATRVQDTADNVSNRFDVAGELNALVGQGRLGPFWGCPVSRVITSLHPRSPGFPLLSADGQRLQRLRLVEARLPGTQETWKLFGNGSVGSQALVGIPYVHRLRHSPDFERVSRVWPFETGFTSAPVPQQESPYIVHAEIWPGVVEQIVRRLMNAEPELIRDRAQVRAMCEWAAELDETSLLGKQFDSPADLNEQHARTCIQEEGWVLGA